ncbi:MAG: FAD-binding oxidoreductase [Anaerolineales bacterium]|nr:FAD-binding oxidoreductase [Anaerolineales bacterium]
MRRWNAWGDDSVTYPLPDSAAHYLESLVGSGQSIPDTPLEKILSGVPPAHIPEHPLISTDPLDRLKHARGQSLPDWLAIRNGLSLSYPDGVAYPETSIQVRELVTWAYQNQVSLIPYGGGTSVVGHINPLAGHGPVLTIDLGRMNSLIHLDSTSLLATFGAGITGPDLEANLRAHGLTLGHYPQSFEYSTLGGWVATRSSGQQSLRYGRIEKLFAGGVMETPLGRLDLPCFPASAAGPDLRELVLGSEGRLGIITEATLRLTRVPDKEDFHAVFFPNFEHGMAAVRQVLAAGVSLCMLRLSTANETTTTLALAGHETLIGALEKLLAIRGLGSQKCMLLIGFCGKGDLVQANRHVALDITGRHGGVHVGKTFGSQWHKNRFRTPYLRNTLWDMGYAIDTLETATDWSKVPEMLIAIEQSLYQSMQTFNERIHVFTHLSHLYPHGSSIYTTYIFRLAADPAETLQRWQSLKAAASQAILTHGGTISHQHGVGLDHRPYLPSEKGPLGMAALQAVVRQFDPSGIMNPGKLVW